MRDSKLCFDLLDFFKRIFSYNIKKSAVKTQTTVRISYYNWYRLTFVVACLAAFLCLLSCHSVSTGEQSSTFRWSVPPYRNPSGIFVRLDFEEGLSDLHPKDDNSLLGQANFLYCYILKMETVDSAEMWMTYQWTRLRISETIIVLKIATYTSRTKPYIRVTSQHFIFGLWNN